MNSSNGSVSGLATHSWLPGPRPDPTATVRLFCLPHAGAGASSFRDWQQHLPPRVAVCPVQPPGRETRFRERPYTRAEPLVRDLVAALLPELDRPFAIYGHSMGALVAFELARALRAGGHPPPAHLFVSGRPAPQAPAEAPALHDLESGALITALQELGGTPAAVLRNPDLRDLLMPLVRADFAVNETYRYRQEPPLAIPLTVYHGIADPRVSAEQARAWHAQTTGAFDVTYIPGNHFFLVTNRLALLRDLSVHLGQLT